MSDPKKTDEKAASVGRRETTDRKISPSAATKKGDPPRTPYRLTPDNPFTNAWKYAGIVGVIGLGGAAFGYTTDAKRFAFSYLFAFLFFLTIALGAIFFTLIQHLTSAGWSVTVRRTSEFFGRGIFIFALLFVPVWLSMGHLFPWFHGSVSGHEAPHAEVKAVAAAHEVDPGSPSGSPSGSPEATQKKILNVEGRHDDAESHAAAGTHEAQRGDPDELIEERVIRGKSPYLNVGFFTGRAIFYFIVWAFLGLKLFRFSTKQDESRDPKLTVSAQRFSPPAMIFFALTLTFAAFDWIMSLQPGWYSTIFGVYIFAGSVVAIHATIIVTTLALRSTGILTKAINTEHYHDLGKLLFGFLVFWAYIGFSQFMLIWYAALPEEVTFFHMRWDNGPWKLVSTGLILLHFAVPFFLLISRNTKRKMFTLALGASWLIAMHALDIYWLVMPNYGQADFSVHWLDLACFLGVGGVYLSAVFYGMLGYPLIPIGDPRLPRALHFENA
jgi:hypothetical protein